MDSISSQIKIIFKVARADARELKEKWQIILGVVGDFTIQVGNKVLYSETEFCLVEIAIQVWQWLERVSETGENFLYNSLEYDEPGLVWIKRQEPGWLIGSVNQEYEEKTLFTLNEISVAFNKYVSVLRSELYEKFGIDITKLITGEVEFYSKN